MAIFFSRFDSYNESEKSVICWKAADKSAQKSLRHHFIISTEQMECLEKDLEKINNWDFLKSKQTDSEFMHEMLNLPGRVNGIVLFNLPSNGWIVFEPMLSNWACFPSTT